ncbi:hypothetical protein GR11A_00223 [Vibrio phage vB_VcorM_GR11A]|nr:hypothetical protein GR11A_00223 [Vibrio phage vB_VcorM_GR11A]
MQTVLGIKVGERAHFADKEKPLVYDYSVEAIEKKSGRYMIKVSMTVGRRGTMIDYREITIPQNETIALGKIKLAARKVTDEMAVIHFMHPQWCRVVEEKCSFKFSELDYKDKPTNGERRPKNKGYKNHRSSRTQKLQHTNTSGQPTKRSCSASPTFAVPYGNGGAHNKELNPLGKLK